MLPFALQDNLGFGFSSELPVRLMSHTSLVQGCARELVALVVCSMSKLGGSGKVLWVRLKMG